jgi:hypothetical protein
MIRNMTVNQHATAEELLEVVFSVVCAMTVAMQWHGNHASTTIEGLCFLRGLCRNVITGMAGATS